MMMNDCSAAVAQEVLAAVAGLEAGTLTLGEAQSVLQSAIPRFENDGSGVANAVRLVEANLEEIQFTTLFDDQTPAAIFRLTSSGCIGESVRCRPLRSSQGRHLGGSVSRGGFLELREGDELAGAPGHSLAAQRLVRRRLVNPPRTPSVTCRSSLTLCCGSVDGADLSTGCAPWTRLVRSTRRRLAVG